MSVHGPITNRTINTVGLAVSLYLFGDLWRMGGIWAFLAVTNVLVLSHAFAAYVVEAWTRLGR